MTKRIGSPEEFRQLRLLVGYTFRDLERLSGVNASWLCQHERRRYTLPLQHQETIFALLLQAVEIRAAIIEKVLGDRKIHGPALTGARGRGS